MAKLRKFAAYRRRESRPYTRKSKYREKSYIRASPTCKVIRFDMGNLRADFPYTLHLSVNSELQIRHNSLEAARLTANRHLEKNLGKQGFYLKLRTYPHHFLRENPLASGAGADRMSTGMKCAFGKIVGLAAQLDKGQRIFSVSVNKAGIPAAKMALAKSAKKLPCGCTVVFEENKGVKEVPQIVEETVEDVEEEPVESTESSEDAVEAVKTADAGESKEPETTPVA
ncbi:MAG: 50S ribosomal protein L16 [Nanoarchaeota archaeon]